jgi:hypothetical protein
MRFWRWSSDSPYGGPFENSKLCMGSMAFLFLIFTRPDIALEDWTEVF